MNRIGYWWNGERVTGDATTAFEPVRAPFDGATISESAQAPSTDL